MTPNDIFLDEGIKYFKDSKRIERVIPKLEKKLSSEKISDEDKEQIRSIITRLKGVIKEFEEVEKEYAENSKKVSKQKYKELKNKYKDILSYVKSEECKKALIGVGLFSVVAGSLYAGISFMDETLTNHYFTIGKTGISTNYTDAGLKKMVARICRQQDINFRLVSSLVDKESKWNPTAIGKNPNGTYDYGLFQLNSGNSKMFVKYFWDRKDTFDFKNPEHNAYVGIKFFKSLIVHYKGDVKKALQAYNAGMTAVSIGDIPPSTLDYAAEIYRKYARG